MKNCAAFFLLFGGVNGKTICNPRKPKTILLPKILTVPRFDIDKKQTLEVFVPSN